MKTKTIALPKLIILFLLAALLTTGAMQTTPHREEAMAFLGLVFWISLMLKGATTKKVYESN